MRAAALFLALAGCAGMGERAGGGCPTGEVCSDQTPNGLGFLGAALGDQPLGRMAPLPLAVGGVETIRAVTGNGAGAPPFTRSFAASSTADSVLGVDRVAPPDVTVRGRAAGSAYLRLTETDDGPLYDRIQLQVRPVDRVRVRPREAAIATTDKGFAENPDAGWVLSPGKQVPLLVQLTDASGARLVDEELVVVASGALSLGERDGWDVRRATAGPGGGALRVTAGGAAPRDLPVRVATRVTDVQSVPAVGAASSTGEPQRIGSSVVFCFRALSGTDLVAGASWSYQASAGLATSVALAASCVTVTGTAVGTLTVEADGVGRDFLLSFL